MQIEQNARNKCCVAWLYKRWH